MHFIKNAFAILSTLVIVACNPGGGGGSYTPLTLAEEFTENLNYYYSTTYGSDFSLVKEFGYEAPDYTVIYDHLNGEYIAFNLVDYYSGMNMDTYFNGTYSEDIIGDLIPMGDGFYYSDVYDIIFEETTGSTKDLEKVGHFIEAKKVNDAGKKIAAEFGLSEKRGIEIAKLTSQWNTLKKKRALTDSDADAFSSELLGVNLTEAQEAFKKSAEGEKAPLEALFQKAATTNSTTPERINKIFNDILTK
ncbi:hypothetical protein OAB57_01690 [Bacteriovoracaceae bacterium]|nr:hypothetical protein [Bacteriovoracaceae bacterium]